MVELEQTESAPRGGDPRVEHEPTGDSLHARMRRLSRRTPRGLGEHAILGAVHAALVASAVVIVVQDPTFESPWIWLLPPLWCAIAWLDHAALTRLHEAAHGMLTSRRLVNEMLGVLIGTLSLTPLAVYRFVHHRHHAHLGGVGDPEFWPYNLPDSARWVRLVYAWSELLFGWLLTPVLYSVRTAACWRTIPPHQRRRLVIEWTILVLAWIAILFVVEVNGWWVPFLAGHLIPAWLAGTMQTIRKFTEHLGLHGEGIVAMTRTVIYESHPGRAASRSQLHVEHHATHHRFARIPFHVLPDATPIMYENARDSHVFPNHLRAMLDMLPHLADPRLGPQWRESDGTGRTDR